MLTFECPQFEDRQWAQPLLSAEADPACEYSFASIYLWSRAWPQQIARCGGRLLVRIQGKLGLCYLYPAGSGPLSAAVDALAQDAVGNGVPLTLVCVTEAQRAALEEACPGRFAFEEATYLLLFGKLPTKEQLDEFITILGEFRSLPDTFVRDVVMKAPSSNMMNTLQKCVLTLYSYDENPEDISIANVLQQSLKLIAQFPLFCVYGYHAYRHYHLDKSLIIRNPKPELSTAENILRLLRKDGAYTELEAKVLDVALVLHAEHGGGNNSTFTTHVVSSTGTDTYSAVAASLGSLKGPKHGGANLKVQEMFRDIKDHVSNWKDEEALRAYLVRILKKEAFDKAGLIYGIGHAVYTESDPRAVILKEYARKLSEEKGLTREFELYERVERLGG